MKIVTTYGGEPFQIVGLQGSDPFGSVVIGWTRSAEDKAFLSDLRRAGNYTLVRMRSVKNRKTGDA